MISTTWKFPVNFTLKNYTSTLNFEKKQFSIPERDLRFELRIAKTTILGYRTEFFFFVEKKVDYWFFWGDIYRKLP